MNCVIIDDEPKAIAVLERYIGQIPDLKHKGSFRDGLSGKKYLNNNDQIQVVFLDINMPGVNGLELAKSLKFSPLVIFTTAYPEFAVKGFEVEALDYLLKPIEFERFSKAVLKAQQKLLVNLKIGDNENLLNSFILLKSGSVFHKVLLEDILYLKKDGNYVEVITLRKKILIRINMNEIFRLFPERIFVRVHKSYVVSLFHIEVVEVNRLIVHNLKIPIGSTFRDDLIKRLKK